MNYTIVTESKWLYYYDSFMIMIEQIITSIIS